MMNVEMVCGYCSSQILLECEQDDSMPVWLMVYRFADAHIGCGYMTKVHKDEDAIQAADEPDTKTEGE